MIAAFALTTTTIPKMKKLTSLKSLFGAALMALVLSVQAQAVIVTFVPGTSDPWLAGQPDGTTASGGPIDSLDVAPDHSPVFIGTFCPGDVVFWKAGGLVSNTPNLGDGSDPNGGTLFTHYDGAQNGIADLEAPINSLVGVWFGGGTGTPFFMGDNGSAMVPPGQTSLYLGTMDGYEWNNNTGGFEVGILVRSSGHCVPEGGSFAVLYVLAAGLMGLGVVRRKPRAA